MTALVRDLRYAVRQWLARPGFAVAVVVTLALGIGLNSAVFSLVDALLLAPLPVRASDELVSVFSSDPGDVMASSPLSAPDFNDLRDRCRSFDDLAAYTYTPMALEVGEESSLALGVRATEGFFDVLGVQAARGRLFSPDEPPGDVVLSHLAWERRFGGDPAVLGRTFRLNGEPSTVVGVLPESFFGLTRGVAPEVWVPMRTEGPRDEDTRFLWVVGRLTPEATLREARSELDAVGETLAAELPATHAERDFVALPTDGVRILPGIDATLGTASLLVMGVVVLVLLVAGTNVANLLLARGLARRREIATRLALGARPATVARQLLTESLLLALAGGGLGLLIVFGTNAALSDLRLPLPIDVALGLAVNGRVLLFTFVVSVLSAVTFGLMPALTATRLDLVEALCRGTAPSLSPRRLGGALVIVQVAASLVLLLDAGLAVRSLGNAHRVDLGFDPSGVAVATFAPQLQGRSPGEAELFYDRLLDEVRTLPAVESAALASHLPLTVELRVDRVATGADAPAERWPSVDMALVGPGYFETLRIEVQSGRTFRDTDRAGAPRVAVVNRSLADRFWPGGDAVGRRLLVDGVEEPYEVIGVVADGKYRTLGESARPFLYRSLEQDGGTRRGVAGEVTTASQTLLVRTRGPAAAVLADLRRAARELDPGIAFARLERLEDTLEIVLFLPRAAAGSFALFGLLALVLASLGVYSLMVYTVSWRIREIGIRMALGATRRQVVGLVVRRALTLVVCGVGGGLALAFATTRMLSAVLYGVSPTDPPTVLVVTSLLLAVALAASLLPARRASGIRVATALRVD